MSNPTAPTINPNAIAVFDETGLKLPTLPDLIEQANANAQAIQPNVSVDSNSPVGQANANQALTIFESNTTDEQLFNATNAASVIGTSQDNLYSIIGLVRSPATFTQQPISVVINAPCNLEGLDSSANDINGTGYTIADNVGNKYILANTQNGLLPGTYVFNFRSQNTGSIQSTPNTITNIVTIVNGVSSVNNPTPPTSIGKTGETDSQFRARQQLSVGMSANGSYNGMYSKLAALQGIGFQPEITTDSPSFGNKPLIEIDNNTSNLINGYGTPGHSIWTIIEGGNDDDIAIVLAGCVSTGCGFYGGTNPIYKTIVQPDGSLINIAFSRPRQVIIYLQLVLNNINDSSVDSTIILSISNYIVQYGIFGLGQSVSIGNVVPLVNSAIAKITPNQLTVSLCQISTDGLSWQGEIIPSNIDVQLVFSVQTIEIIIVP